MAEEKKIRVFNDRPIYRAALVSKVDLLLTGDKDFHLCNWIQSQTRPPLSARLTKASVQRMRSQEPRSCLDND
ncbi:MAG: hypothetical protein LBL95_02360, partial [Deltaproteobacteria bacterium]|nr:hypothetical protein [Deltaproteobacteria bacterium]